MQMPHKDSVVAVVVTFNRSQKLAKVLESIIAQSTPPEKIIIVDNASTDDTAVVVATYKARFDVTHVLLPQNIGGAGGFNVGTRLAYEEGFDFVWLMDDDGYPEPNALSVLVSAITVFEERTAWRPSFACSLVKWVDGSICEMNIPVPVWDWPRFLSQDLSVVLVERCSFVSVLVPRWAIKKHGLPIADYFIWYDDAEYTKRLSRSYPGLLCPASLIVHDTPENKGVNFSFVNESNVWKFEYGVRNEVSSKMKDGGWPSIIALALLVRRQMREGNITTRLRCRIWVALLKGIAFRPSVETV